METEPKAPSFAADLPDDLTWLAEHQGTPYTVHTCRMLLRDLPAAVDKHERDQAEARHALGTKFIDLITHGAVATMNRATVAQFLELDCGLDPDEGYEYVRFAKGVTAEEAVLYRFSRCKVGIRLVRKLGRKGLKELAARPFDVEREDHTTESVAFTPKTPVSKLRWALARLNATPAEPPAEPETPSRTIARRLREMSEVVDAYLDDHPVLEDAALRVTLYAGKARVHHRPLATNDEFVAIAELYLELAKVR